MKNLKKNVLPIDTYKRTQLPPIYFAKVSQHSGEFAHSWILFCMCSLSNNWYVMYHSDLMINDDGWNFKQVLFCLRTKYEYSQSWYIHSILHMYNSTQLSSWILFVSFPRTVQKTLAMENIANLLYREGYEFHFQTVCWMKIIITIFQNKRRTYFCFQRPRFPAAISLSPRPTLPVCEFLSEYLCRGIQSLLI